MVLLTDGTSCEDMAYLESLPLMHGLRERLKYGRGQKDAYLESRRRAAIDWMRRYSKRGWVYDRMLTSNTPKGQS